MNLFADEQILTTTDGNIVTLTTHRIRYTNQYGWGATRTTSIMLEKISSIQVTVISYPLLLIIAALIIVVPFAYDHFQYRASDGQVSIIIGAVFLILYFITRRQICMVSSDGGGKIIFETRGMPKEGLLNFIDGVEKAKNRRVMGLSITA